MNTQIKTTFFLALLTILVILIGKLLGGSGGMIVALIFALVMNGVSYWFSDKIILSIYKAKEISATDFPNIFSMVSRLAVLAQIPMPKIYLVDNDSPNAFATGRNPSHGALALTTGLIKIMKDSELEGVIAHEIAHIKDRDILISSVAAVLAGAIMMLANMARFAAFFGGFGRGDNDEEGGENIFSIILLAILAPIAAMLIQFAISRSREYLADSNGAKIAGNPFGLADALEKLDKASKRIPLEANSATAHIFIVAPLSSGSSIFLNLFSTHPPIEERIERLRDMTFRG